MGTIYISVTDKRAAQEGSTVIVCGNSSYSIEFNFDTEWSGQNLKTARFVYVRDGAVKFEEVAFNGSTVAVPVLLDIREVYVGVYAGDLRTTTPARILCDRSIICGGGVHEEPAEDVYNQIIEICNRAVTSCDNATAALEAHNDHSLNTSNPHRVTKTQVGLGNVPNVSTNDQTPSYSETADLSDLKSGEKLSVAFGKLAAAVRFLIAHFTNNSNPHGVTAAQVGLGNVPNVATNNQTPTYSAASTLVTLTSGEKLSVSLGKIAKAITDLISHIGNKANPHNVTADQAGAVPIERLINGKELSNDIMLYYYNVGAAAEQHKHETGDITGLTDYVVANGVSGVWSYWKFNSGLCIAMGTPTVSWGEQSSLITGQYRSTAALDLTGIFTAVMGGTCSNVHRYVNCFVNPSGGTSAELWATSAAAAANSLYSTKPMVVLFGKWK